MLLTQAGVGVLDGLCFTVKAGLRLEDDAQTLHLGYHVHAALACTLFEVSIQSLLHQEQSQPTVLEIFLLTCHGRMIPQFLGRISGFGAEWRMAAIPTGAPFGELESCAIKVIIAQRTPVRKQVLLTRLSALTGAGNPPAATI